jgi:glycosyltransferase involved in cell wall biosynthesis
MKLLYLYRFAILGGVVAQLKNRLKALPPGVEVHLGFLEEHGGISAFQGKAQTCILPTAEELTDLLRKQDYQVISVIDTPVVYPAIAAAKTRALIVNEVHTTYQRSLDYLTELRAMPPMEVLLTPSEYLRAKVLQDYGYEGIRPVQVVPNCLDLDQFTYRPPTVPSKKRILLWVGKLDEHKNWRDFLAFAAQQALLREDCEFWMVGGETAPEESAAALLRDAEQGKLLSRFRWIQRLDYQAMPRLYSLVAQSGGAAVITAIDESFGMSMVEAMACGCPVVASRVGALPEVLAGELSQLLYPLHDLEALLSVMERLLDKAELRRQLAELGRERARLYSHEVVGRKYFELIKTLFEKKFPPDRGA